MSSINGTEDTAAPMDALLRRERKHFSTYWTVMQEMRLRGDLPDWVRTAYPGVGKHEDWDARDADQCATDTALNGEHVPRKYSLGLDAKNEAFLHSQNGWLVFHGKPSELAAKHPDALFEFTPSQLQMYVNALRCEALGHEVAYG